MVLPRFLRRFALVCLALVASSAMSAPDGAKLYHDYCSVCHGDKGDGHSRASIGLVPPPLDFTTPQAAVDLNRKRMLMAVRDGKPGTAMTAWSKRLNEEEIGVVVDFVRDSFMMSATTDELGSGRRIYAEYCSVCHGDKGEGAVWGMQGLIPPPRNFTTPDAISELTRARMVSSVTYGRPETAMSAWNSRLSEEEINDVVVYVRSAFMGKGREEEAAARQQELSEVKGHVPVSQNRAISDNLPHGLVGDLMSGGELYQKNCAECHGASGDGQGPRAYFIFPKPRNFKQPAAQANYSRGFLFEAIAKGRLRSEMPAWDKVLTDQQIADISEYVYQVFISSGELSDTEK